MTCKTVKTQQELDVALALDDEACVHIESERGVWLTVSDNRDHTVEAYGSATVRAYGSATVEAYDSATVEASDSATVEASDSATVRAYGSATVEAYDSATVEASDSATVEAYGSATVRAYGSATVEASDSATVRAYGSATVRAYGSASIHAHLRSRVTAGSHVAVHLHSGLATVSGGVVIDVTDLVLTDPATWCEHHGVDVENGRAVLYKALGDDLTAGQGWAKPTVYAVGADVSCDDWRDDNECGGGLHLSPAPSQAREYNTEATRYLRCTVDLSALRPILGGTPKCKVPTLRVEAEVDLFRRELAAA